MGGREILGEAASFPVVLGEISIVTSPDELGGKIRSVPSLPQSLDNASRPGDETVGEGILWLREVFC